MFQFLILIAHLQFEKNEFPRISAKSELNEITSCIDSSFKSLKPRQINANEDVSFVSRRINIEHSSFSIKKPRGNNRRWLFDFRFASQGQESARSWLLPRRKLIQTSSAAVQTTAIVKRVKAAGWGRWSGTRGKQQARPRKVGDDGGCYWQRGHSSR